MFTPLRAFFLQALKASAKLTITFNGKAIKMELAFMNTAGRIQCGGMEFCSGDLVQIRVNNTQKWITTTIERDHIGFHSTDGIALIGNEIRLARP